LILRPLIFVVFFLVGWNWTDSWAGNLIEKIDPPHWWTQMKDQNLQLLLYGKDLGLVEVHLQHHPGVHLRDIIRCESEDYLILNMEIGKHLQGNQEFVLEFSRGGEKQFLTYRLKERTSIAPQGLDQSDYLYLITPDRFSNGNPQNDIISEMRESTLNREEDYGRHGGDLQGIANHLDYIKELGMTAIWLNPVLENDQNKDSYHGYAITDHYRIDPRFGSNEEYFDLSRKCRENGIKLIKDLVFNHFGDQHPLVKNPPFKKWINRWPSFTRTNYRAATLMDPYVSDFDKRMFTDGWFDSTMPDMNVRNPLLATYLIQNTIWWIEEAGIDALRIDTYSYPDQFFMKSWAGALRQEYPDLFMYAEAWVHYPGIQGYFMGDQGLHRDFDNRIQAMMDFQLTFALNDMVKEEQGWNSGIAKVYYVLIQDYLYDHPELMVTFLDNHDLARFYGTCHEDFLKYQMGLVLLSTLRGIPCLYYGTEILMKQTENHGVIREDFPGGWPGDASNKFSASGRIGEEQKAFQFISKLANFRKEHPDLFSGKMVQFVPQDGLFVFFRYHKSEEIMVMANASGDSLVIDIDRYQERFHGFVEYEEILTGARSHFGKDLRIGPWESKIFYFEKEP
jgi:neopullulanase